MTPSPPPPEPVLLLAAPPPPLAPGALAPVDAAWVRAFGPELAPRFGPWGQADLGPLPEPPAAWRATLATSRLLLLPGGPWPGLPEEAGAWSEAWAEAWAAQTGGWAKALRPLRGGTPPWGHEARGQELALAALAEAPATGPLVILGHSYGAKLAKALAEALQAQGQAVAAVAMVEVQAPHTGFFAREAPRGVPRLLIAENAPGCWPERVPGQGRAYLLAPAWAHMDWVLRPPAALWRALYALAASPSWPEPGGAP